jgi:hypothetical protein
MADFCSPTPCEEPDFCSPTLEELEHVIEWSEANPDPEHDPVEMGDIYWDDWLAYTVNEEGRDVVKAEQYLQKALALNYPPAQVSPFIPNIHSLYRLVIQSCLTLTLTVTLTPSVQPTIHTDI